MISVGKLCATALLGVFLQMAHAEEKVMITGVLAKPAKFYKQADLTTEITDESWPAKSDFSANPKKVIESKDSFLQVEENGKKVWVLMRYVRTDRQIRMAEACGSMANDNLPRSATTRGVGERCVQK